MNNKYRFDDAYSSVYEYDLDIDAYIHIGSYLAFGIEKTDQDNTKIRKVEDQ